LLFSFLLFALCCYLLLFNFACRPGPWCWSVSLLVVCLLFACFFGCCALPAACSVLGKIGHEGKESTARRLVFACSRSLFLFGVICCLFSDTFDPPLVMGALCSDSYFAAWCSVLCASLWGRCLWWAGLFLHSVVVFCCSPSCCVYLASHVSFDRWVAPAARLLCCSLNTIGGDLQLLGWGGPPPCGTEALWPGTNIIISFASKSDIWAVPLVKGRKVFAIVGHTRGEVRSLRKFMPPKLFVAGAPKMCRSQKMGDLAPVVVAFRNGRDPLWTRVAPNRNQGLGSCVALSAASEVSDPKPCWKSAPVLGNFWRWPLIPSLVWPQEIVPLVVKVKGPRNLCFGLFVPNVKWGILGFDVWAPRAQGCECLNSRNPGLIIRNVRPVSFSAGLLLALPRPLAKYNWKM